MKNKKIVIGVLVCLVVAGLSFWGGMKYGQSKNSNFALNSRQGGFNQNLVAGQNGGRIGMRGSTGGGFVTGEILSKDEKSMTIKIRDGGSKIVFFSPTTKVEKTVDGTIVDASVGKQVTIVGTTNSDGSVVATSIQMRPDTTLPMMQVKSN